METITILGDSLAMVRPWDGIYYKDTYAFKLATLTKNSHTLINKARRTNITSIQATQFQLEEDVLYNNSEFVIIHLGICDCAPRLFSRRQQRMLEIIGRTKFKFISDLIIHFKSKRRFFFTKYFPKQYVKVNEFRHSYETILNSILEQDVVKTIIIINIADTSKMNKSRSFGFEENINKYNEEIRSLSQKKRKAIHLIDFFTFTRDDPTLLLPDGIHITKEAHTLLAEEIFSIIGACKNVENQTESIQEEK